jgi:hypothetical protein
MDNGYDIPSIIKKVKRETGYKKPDLIFYYSVYTNENNDGSGNTAIIEEIDIGNTGVFITKTSNIYRDYALTERIGRYCNEMNIFGKNNPDSNNLYNGTGSTTYFLKENSITINETTKYLNIGNGYIYPYNVTENQRIVSGTKKYLTTNGIVSVSTNNTKTRLVLVYLNKCC